jgi:hypothetical protein
VPVQTTDAQKAEWKAFNAEAEPLYRRSLAIRERALGPDHPDVAHTLWCMATLYRMTGRDKEAEELEKRAAAIRAKKR